MKIRFIQIFVLTAIIIASYSFYFYNTGIKLNKNASGENKIANQIATTTETKEGAKNEQDTTDKTISVVKEQSKIETKEIPKTQPKEIITTQPLKGSVEENNAILTAMGVIEETNRQRQLNGLPSLVYNEKLSLAAQNKVNDMFNLQYFAHESPTGAGPADLANDVDYKYLMVGENLALGNYESDKILVDAWMNSPGHRANILNPKYTEIGVSVKSGMYEGYNTWLSVQEFGRPESDCPIPDKNLEQEILSGKGVAEQLKNQVSTLYEEINAMWPKSGSVYQEKVSTYNILVEQYNRLVESLKSLIANYNNQVSLYNQCI
ncbi:hypothetical protein A3I18_00215 [Candidatus Campbellbacteria bacterium RIFCSPLOWO2_02_FULL_35_11]|uniref:SCP domain-containing protein n=2 Tax=Candidatus Campbelliibacteriota TaxID=1752727 RepID=A0A1F5ENQ3_9BACT|nr:MAG: hypothetical protein A3E89_01170 [Candidatus Campbellbacteria bacterium RIFCSPHIGHO2_12_FULL_35_10]OGD70062.1 MAG: hypothetical protein A3I18_00215 [Candidatus Campbellbacteria bacterium RIFCSPLOWO2_02_FULL_35_11]